jgi:hypothetical protein
MYKINVDTYFKILNNVKSCTLLNVLTLNLEQEINSINFKSKPPELMGDTKLGQRQIE